MKELDNIDWKRPITFVRWNNDGNDNAAISGRVAVFLFIKLELHPFWFELKLLTFVPIPGEISSLKWIKESPT